MNVYTIIPEGNNVFLYQSTRNMSVLNKKGTFNTVQEAFNAIPDKKFDLFVRK